MSKDQYLRMIEQTGEEIDWDRCPPDYDDFPSSVQVAMDIYQYLGSKIYADVGFTGKDYSNLNLVLESNKITTQIEKDWVLEILLTMEGHAIQESQRQIKAEIGKHKK